MVGRGIILAAVALALALPGGALATHMSSYTYAPVEHDDLGRSAEPDFAMTAVLGPTLVNCVASPSLAPGCIPDPALPPVPPGQSAVLAPGCTDDAGRQPSGLCGLHTVGAGNGNTGVIVPPGQLGTPGMGGDRAPGRFTPNKGTVVRFLDSRVDLMLTPPLGGYHTVDYPGKFADAKVGAPVGPSPDLLLPGPAALWAWYGVWQDKNGNGVIDHLRAAQECSGWSCPPGGGVAAANEFVWIGGCIQFNGQSAPAGQQYCRFEAGTLLPVWVYPGNHHATPGYLGCVTWCYHSIGDLPGRQVYTYLLGSTCPSATCEEELAWMDAEYWGDPLLGEQDSRRTDHRTREWGGVWGMGDQTGDVMGSNRAWVYGFGWPTWFYDQGLLVSTVIVTAATRAPPVPGLETDFDLAALDAVDVDRYEALSPLTDALLQGTVKPAARGAWALARWSVGEVACGTDCPDVDRWLRASRLAHDQCDPAFGVPCPLPVSPAEARGRASDRVLDPGWAREPNTDLDAFPGARRVPCAEAFATHQGQCNDYAAHAVAPHAWLDLQEFNAYYSPAWRTPIGNCILCITGGPLALPDLPDGLRAADGFGRVLDPGSHAFVGRLGLWWDRPQAHEERAIDVVGSALALELAHRAAAYVVPADGFVGDVVNATGFARVAGFAPESCEVGGAVAVREYAQCHPYADGNLDGSIAAGGAPQDYRSGEFTPAEGGGSGPGGRWQLTLRPVDGCWSVPVLVWRAFDTWTVGDLGPIEDHTGRCGPIVLAMDGWGGALWARDLLVLPSGNAHEAVITEASGTVAARVAGRIVAEPVRDVDAYAAWGTP